MSSRLVAQVPMERGPYALKAKQNLVFATERDRIFVVDVSNPQAPVQKAVIEMLDHDPEFRSLAVGENLLFAGSVAVGGKEPGVFVFDISHPESPKLLGHWDDGGTVVHGLFWNGQTLFVSGSDASHGRLLTMELRDNALQRVGLFQSDADKGYGRLWVHRDRAFLPEATGGLRVVDVSDPSKPRPGAFIRVQGQAGHEAAAKQLVVHDNTLFMANWGAGMACFDVSEPDNPKHISTLGHKHIPSGASVYSVAVQGSKAYLANGWGCLTEVDVSDPARPRVLREFKFQHTYYLDLALLQNHAVCADKGGFTNKPGLDIVAVANGA